MTTAQETTMTKQTQPKKPSANDVAGRPGTMTIGGRVFNAGKFKVNEKPFIMPIGRLEAQMYQGDELAGEKYVEVVSALLAKRAMDGEPVTLEWASDQDDGEVSAWLMAVITGDNPKA